MLFGEENCYYMKIGEKLAKFRLVQSEFSANKDVQERLLRTYGLKRMLSRCLLYLFGGYFL